MPNFYSHKAKSIKEALKRKGFVIANYAASLKITSFLSKAYKKCNTKEAMLFLKAFHVKALLNQ
tara:strand:+ start:264 stop:455 length:192 start_codon:yes stop_codon:yes gene_type:complete